MMLQGFSVIMLRSRLRRICKNKKTSDGQKTKKIESILKKSKLPVLTRLYREDPDSLEDTLALVLGSDTCTLCVHSCDSEFEPRLRSHLERIQAYNQLIGTVESLRRVPYNADNNQHEDMLLQLWDRLCPYKKLRAKVTRQWTEIGFQSRNPRTDFRGMGILGLHNLLFFASQYPEKARELLEHSKHEKYGYSFAIVGINMTLLAYNLLCQNLLKSYMYHTVRGPVQLHHFHNFYCYLLCEFDRFWMEEKPVDLMQFTAIKSKFEKKTLALLSSKNLSINHMFINNDCQKNNRHLQVDKKNQINDGSHENDIMNTSYYMWV